MMLTGVLGGTFDPVHFGHLRPAVDVAEQLGLETLLLIPCHVSPHRHGPEATPEQRLEMLRRATASHPVLSVDDRELRRMPPSYTVETLRELSRERPREHLVFVLGGDAFAAFRRWQDWQEILALAHLAVTTRPGFAVSLEDYDSTGDPAELRSRRAGLVMTCEVTALDISATDIRARRRRGADIAYLLPSTVKNYIDQEELYARH